MKLHSETIDYRVDEQVHRGYLAYDAANTRSRPGILLVHEWWGLNDYIKKRAHMLAELGYLALAIDMYGDGSVANDPDQAGRLMNGVLGDMDKGTRALQAGYQQLLEQPLVDSRRTAAAGYCFGGAMVLHMARIGMPLSAVASFHGSLGSFHRADPGSIKAKLLICHGEADSMVTLEDLQAFREEMDAASVDYEVLLLPAAKHGFSNPEADINAQKYGIDLAYQKQADVDSWAAMKALFARVF